MSAYVNAEWSPLEKTVYRWAVEQCRQGVRLCGWTLKRHFGLSDDEALRAVEFLRRTGDFEPEQRSA